jgi:A/G-specific adenine glycosylase
VIPYYRRFLDRFPDVHALAAADEDAVLRLWSGLGYYARARNLHAAARELVRRGAFPRDAGALQALPGIGRSTAGAIAVFAFGCRAAILDGNVKRVLARCFGSDADLWERSESLVPARGVQGYTQALMDLGATVCTRSKPSCHRCPLAAQCVARGEGRIAELPARKARKAVPLRKSTWLVLVSGGEVLLERRPAPGLWGGLWTFPELQRGRAKSQCRDRYGCEISGPVKLAPIEHGFTHFKLRAQPVLCPVRSRSPRAEQGGRIWIGIHDAASAAVPVPVKMVLGALRSV